MALEEDLAEDGTSSPAASTSQVPQAASPDASEDIICPICQDTITNEASISWCSHIFCFACILEWSRRRAVCPLCCWPFHYIYRKVQANNCEVYHLVQYHSSASHAQRPRARFVERRRRHSSGNQHRSSSSGDRGSGRARARERVQSRFPRQHHDGHSRQDYDPSSSRRQQQSRAQDTAYDEAQAPRPEHDVLASSGRNERHRQGGRVSFREQQAMRSRSPRRSCSTWRRTQQEQQRRRRRRRRRRDRDEEQDPSPEWQVPAYSGRRWCYQQGGRVFSREQQAMRSRSPRRSCSTWRRTQQVQQRRRRRRDRDEEQDPSPEWQVPAYSGRRWCYQQGGRVFSRERQATRSQSPRRSRSTWRRTQQVQQRRRRRRDRDEEQDPSPEWQVPPSPRISWWYQQGGQVSSREQQARRSRSPQRSHRPARHRDW